VNRVHRIDALYRERTHDSIIIINNHINSRPHYEFAFCLLGPVVTVFRPPPYGPYCTPPKCSCLERSGRRGAVLWVSLSAVTAARGPGEYCRHGRSGRPKNPHAPRTHKTTPTRRFRRAARPSEHLRDDEDELLFLFSLSLSLSLSNSLSLYLYAALSTFFTPPSGMCAVTAATEYEVAAVSYYVYTVFFGRPPNTRSANKWPHAECRKNTGHETQPKIGGPALVDSFGRRRRFL